MVGIIITTIFAVSIRRNYKIYNKMKAITNSTGTKKVKFHTSDIGTITAFYVQVYNNEEQVLDSRDYNTENGALRWAKKQLS